jgi:hypothetical protein
MRTSIFLALAFAVFQMSAQTPAKNNSDTSYSAGSKEDLARLAGQMLDNTNQARTALKRGDHQVAIQDVNRARADLQKIEAQAHGATMVPLYREFVSISILAPVRAEQQARNNQRPEAVQQVAGDYTRALVSTPVAKNGLDAAKAAVDKQDWKTADAALSDVQDGVQVESFESDMPLSRARENLILARAAVRQGHYTEASAALNGAAKALSNYEPQGGAHSSEARQMQHEIEKLGGNIAQQHADAIATINKWWNTTSSWTPYATSQASARR